LSSAAVVAVAEEDGAAGFRAVAADAALGAGHDPAEGEAVAAPAGDDYSLVFGRGPVLWETSVNPSRRSLARKGNP